MNGQRDDNMQSRVTRVETALTSQSDQIKELGSGLQTLNHRVENGFESIRQAIFSGKQTPWTVLVSGGALIITLVMLVITTLGGIRGEMGARFVEVETQFRGVAKEMQTQVDNNKERSLKSDKDLDSLRAVVNGVDGAPGLKEKLAKAEQKLEDHDKYLWPVQLEEAKRQAELSSQTSRNSASIEAISKYLDHRSKAAIPAPEDN